MDFPPSNRDVIIINYKRGPVSYCFCRDYVPGCVCISFIYIHIFLKSKHDIKNEKRDDTGRCDVMQLPDNSPLFLQEVLK